MIKKIKQAKSNNTEQIPSNANLQNVREPEFFKQKLSGGCPKKFSCQQKKR